MPKQPPFDVGQLLSDHIVQIDVKMQTLHVYSGALGGTCYTSTTATFQRQDLQPQNNEDL